MRMPKRGEKGFTLIELLIVVAILGVLAAIVIPNVGRFIGRGETEAASTEFANVQSAVVAMMTDNNLSTLPNPVTLLIGRTNSMGAFPDASSAGGSADKLHDVAGGTYTGADKAGYLLYQHDRIADGATGNLTNYVATPTTSKWYTVDAQGTVTQYLTAS